MRFELQRGFIVEYRLRRRADIASSRVTRAQLRAPDASMKISHRLMKRYLPSARSSLRLKVRPISIAARSMPRQPMQFITFTLSMPQRSLFQRLQRYLPPFSAA
jgi:hypothetical protein